MMNNRTILLGALIQKLQIVFWVVLFLSPQIAFANTSLACPEIALPSVIGSKSAFRYIDVGCDTIVTIKPNYGVSGGKITGYEVYSIPYEPPFPFDAGTKIFIDQDDIWGNIIQLPFRFCFFEYTYDKAVVGANGLVSFNTSVANQPSGWCLEGKRNIPDKNFLGADGLNWGNAIYGVFEDIDPRKISLQGSGGSIRYGLLGTYPCRTLTISWNKVPNYSCYSGSKYWDSFQIVLYEGTNVIDVYVNHKSRCASWNLGRGIIGIQNKDCTKALAAPNRNTTDSWSADREAWRFVPTGNPVYTITYYEGMGVNGRILGRGDEITFNPTNIAAITARLQFTAANGETFDLRDTAVIVHTEVQKVTTNKTICESGSYDWRGQTYTESGIYTEGVGGSNGCYDKIYELNLTISNTVGKKEYKTICRGDNYYWNGKTYTNSGTFYDRKKDSSGCETIDTLILTVNDSYHFYELDTICEGETHTWHNNLYTQSGSYVASYQTKLGCDSIYHLDLKVANKYLFPTEAYLCEGKAYKWRGNTYKEAGIYTDSLVSSMGCDSIYQLTLLNSESYHIEEFDTICEGETYYWHGQNFITTGTYYDNLTSSKGCDSIHTLHLFVAKNFHFVEENGIRSNQEYEWRGRILTQPGQYYDSLKTTDGCDSIYQLNLARVPNYYYTRTDCICRGETLTWRGKQYSESGVYYDSLVSVIYGTDSIYQLHLTVIEVEYYEGSVTICKGETYAWRNQLYNQSGIYYDTIRTNNSRCLCDSVIYQLNLTVGEPFHDVTNASFCNGENYEWRGFQYTKPGVYYDEYTTILGCDSIYQLNLTQYQKYLFHQLDTICEGQSFHWREKIFTKTGIYWDSLQSINGCDSIYCLELTVAKPFIDEEYVTICDNEVYDWRGGVYKSQGIYYDSLKTYLGCDSIYILHLTVKPTYLTKEYATICENEEYVWRGNSYNRSDMYYDYYTTSDGCDSIFSLSLTVMPTYYHKETAYICGGESFIWNNKIYTQAGVYIDSLKSISGCDSVVELTLGIADNYFFEEEYSTCEGAVYSWHGQEISMSGIYWDSLKTIYGCDSIYKLSITFHPIYHFVTETTICQGEQYDWIDDYKDTLYMIDSVYYYQLSTCQECDSLYELRLRVLPTYNIIDTAFFCQGETFIWRNRPLTNQGIYHDSLQTIKNCDSIYTLYLIEHPSYHFSFFDTINEGEIYSWRNKEYTQSGTYYDSLTTMYGCDSISTLFLTVHPRYHFSTNDTICEGEQYMWQGKVYTKTGTYYATYQTIHGNDSIYELRLAVMPIYHSHTTDHYCSGSNFFWREQHLSLPGVYYDSLKTIYGCDSIFSLELKEAPTYDFYISDSICLGDTYSFGDEVFTEGGEFVVAYQTLNGCDSLYHISLYQQSFPAPQFPIDNICADDQFLYIVCKPLIDSNVLFFVSFNDVSKKNGFEDVEGILEEGVISISLPKNMDIEYLEPNTYGGTLTLLGDICKQQHIYEFSFDVLYPSSIVIQKFNDVLAVQNKKYNGGYIFTKFQWYADGEPIPNANLSYFYGKGSLSASIYQVMLTRNTDGVSMLTCPIEPVQADLPNFQSSKSKGFNTIIDINNPIVYLQDENIQSVSVYNMSGGVLFHRTLDAKEHQLEIQLSPIAGVYLMIVSYHSGTTENHKLFVQ